MSEFLNRTKITALERSNSELLLENSTLVTEIQKLKAELGRLNAKDSGIIELEDEVLENNELNELIQLREKIADYQRRETELKELIRSVSDDLKTPKKQHMAVRHLLSALQVEDRKMVESLIDHYDKKKRTSSQTIAFLLGILVTLGAWVVTAYLNDWNNWKSYLPFWR